MGKSTPAAPPAPDPVATAQAQAQGNSDVAKLNARLNRADQYTPQVCGGNAIAANEPGACQLHDPDRG